MIRITKETDNSEFVWKVLSEKQARFAFISGVFELYILYDDDSDSLVNSIKEIDAAVKEGAQLAIEVGFYENK